MVEATPEMAVPRAPERGRYRWNIRPVDRACLALDAYLPLIRHLLWGRGIRDGVAAMRFLDEAVGPSTTATEHDPFLLPQMDRAVARLRQAHREGELVAAYGDFDADGITSTALLLQGLGSLGFRTVPYIPDRFREGYGLTKPALAELRRVGATVVVTMDCGISSVDEVAYAQESGMDVIILDHHSVPDVLPDSAASVNPRFVESMYPTADLAACGVTYKLLQAVHEAMGRQFVEEDYLDLVALGTVADMAALVGENREIVQRGLRALSRTKRVGLQALMTISGCDTNALTARDLGFGLGPRINAAGRLTHAHESLDLLLETDPAEAERKAEALNAVNLERRRQQDEAIDLARSIVQAEGRNSLVTFVGDPSISSGIVGLVAGRLAEELYRPAIVYQPTGEFSRASARSIPAFDIVGALRRHGPLMERFGGHRQAAGFTVANNRRDRLREGLEATAEELLTAEDLEPVLDIDAALPLGMLRGEEIRWLSRFEPFGIGNPELTFLSRNVEIVECKPVGEDGAHLRLKLRDGAVTWPAIAFRNGFTAEPGSRANVVYTLSPDRFGSGALELQVKDISPA